MKVSKMADSEIPLLVHVTKGSYHYILSQAIILGLSVDDALEVLNRILRPRADLMNCQVEVHEALIESSEIHNRF